jgi:WD40 repeat protein/mono/diheme cytochrome c family protein
MRFARLGSFICLAMLIGGSRPASADDAAAAPPEDGQISYHRQIKPIFQANCQGCHQPAKALGGLVMTGMAELLKGGESQSPGIVPGKPDESQVLLQITSQGGNPPAMPKDRPALTPDQVDLVRRWIAEGAKDDSPVTDREVIDMDHPPTYAGAPVVTSVSYSPDGSLLAVSGYHEVVLHAADGSQVVGRLVGLSERIESAEFSPDGALLAVTGGSPGRFGEVQIWDVASRTLKLSVAVTYDTIYGASWSPDGTKVAFGCGDNTLRAIDAASGEQVLYQGAHSDWVLDTVFSTDASHLISVSRDRSTKLTEVATQRFVDNITSITPGALKGGLMMVARHPTQDVLLLGGADGVPKLYKTYREKDRQIGDDFNKILEFAAMPGRIRSGAFNADGSRVVVGSSSDGTGEVRVYQTADAQLICQAQGQPGPVYAVAFSPDGQRFAAGGFDGMVRLYDANTGQLLTEFVSVPLAASVAAAGY